MNASSRTIRLEQPTRETRVKRQKHWCLISTLSLPVPDKTGMRISFRCCGNWIAVLKSKNSFGEELEPTLYFCGAEPLKQSLVSKISPLPLPQRKTTTV